MTEIHSYPPKSALSERAHVASMADYDALYRRSIEEGEAFWLEQAERLDWFVPPTSAGHWMYGADEVDVRWYAGGKLNACVQCVDRHAAKTPDKTAIIWAKDEVGEYEHISYAELERQVGRMANVLRFHGVGKGDRICIYMPMIPELAYATLACARIGAIHSIVFAGFSANALRDRIVDCGSRVVLTADEGLRGGKRVPLKKTTDDALATIDVVDTVLVAQRSGADVSMTPGRDHWLHEEMARQRPTSPAEVMDAEDPLFILYTSGSTGKPKGMLHTTGGYMVWTSMTHELVFDIHDDDVYACVADVGWITGHSYILYGPLANGATTVMFESTPLYPDAGRYWKLVEDLKVTVFYTAPTAIRAIAREGDDWVTQHDRSSLRVLGTVGEPINPEVWVWYHDLVGEQRCAIVDTWWQTETGGIMISPLPGATTMKPGSATRPLPGVQPLLVDDDGNELTETEARGNLCIGRSWPGQARTIYGDHERYRATYFSQYPGRYFTGDGCLRDADGDYWITGRVDDVLNVSGHRMGTAEVESALVAHDAVAEAAVVGYPHEIKGTGIYAYVLLNPGHENDEGLLDSLVAKVREEIGPIAKPDKIQLSPGLPKTRSGKIMRRILRKIAADDYENLGDTSTLADPAVVDGLIEAHKQLG